MTRTRQLPLAAAPLLPSASTIPEAAATLSPNVRPARAEGAGIVDAVCNIILELAEQHGRVTADDVRRLAPRIPFLKSVMGAAFRRLVMTHRIRLIGFDHSIVPGNHGRRIGVYQLHHTKTSPGTDGVTA